MVVRQLKSQHALGRQLLCEDHTDGCLIAVGMAVCRVMQLKYEIRSCRYEFGHSVRPTVRRASGRINEEHIAVGPVSVVLKMRIGETGSGEGNAGRRIPEPRRIRWTNVDDCMMHMLPARWPNLRHLYPFVFGESCRHDFIRVFDVAAR